MAIAQFVTPLKTNEQELHLFHTLHTLRLATIRKPNISVKCYHIRDL